MPAALQGLQGRRRAHTAAAWPVHASLDHACILSACCARSCVLHRRALGAFGAAAERVHARMCVAAGISWCPCVCVCVCVSEPLRTSSSGPCCSCRCCLCAAASSCVCAAGRHATTLCERVRGAHVVSGVSALGCVLELLCALALAAVSRVTLYCCAPTCMHQGALAPPPHTARPPATDHEHSTDCLITNRAPAQLITARHAAGPQMQQLLCLSCVRIAGNTLRLWTECQQNDRASPCLTDGASSTFMCQPIAAAAATSRVRPACVLVTPAAPKARALSGVALAHSHR